MLDSIARAQGIGIGLFTTRCTRISGGSAHSGFCNLIRSGEKDGKKVGGLKCEECDKRNFPSDAKPSGPYRCHAGLLDFSIPLVTSKGIVAGALFGGQVLERPIGRKEIAHFKKIAREYGISEDQLIAAARKLKVVTPNELVQLQELVTELSKTISVHLEHYALDQNLIAQLSYKLSRDQVTQAVVQYIHELTNAEACSLFLVEGEDLTLKATSSDFLREAVGVKGYKSGEGLTGWVFQNSRSLLLADVKDPQCFDAYSPRPVWKAHLVETATKEAAARFMAVPLMSSSTETSSVFGVIRVTRSHDRAPFNQLDLAAVSRVASIVVKAFTSDQSLETAQRNAQALDAISKSSRLVTSNDNRAFDTIVENGFALLREKSGNCGIFVLDYVPAKRAFVVTHAKGKFTEISVGTYLSDKFDVLSTACARKVSTRVETPLLDLFPSARSALAVPISRDKQAMGLIFILSDTRDPFDAEDVTRLEGFANLVGIALEKRLMDRRAKGQLNLLNRAVDPIMSGEGIQTVAAEIAKVVRDEFGGSDAFVYISSAAEQYQLSATTDRPSSEFCKQNKVSYSLGQGLVGWIAQHRRPLRIDNVHDSVELKSLDGDLELLDKIPVVDGCPRWESYLGIPIVLIRGNESDLWGVLEIRRKGNAARFDRDDEEVAISIAGYAAVALTFGAAYTDRELTIRGFAHDAGGPVQTLRRDLEFLPFAKPQEREAWIERITCLAEYLSYLIDTYVLIGRRQHVHLSCEEFHIKPLIDNVLKMALSPFGEKSARLKPHNAVPPDVLFYGDKAKFYIMIYNLAVNAARACANLLRIECQLDEDKLRILVIDDGPGIDIERARLTEPRHEHLGLPIIRLFAKAHGGDLYFESRKGQDHGTTATVWLPLVTPNR